MSDVSRQLSVVSCRFNRNRRRTTDHGPRTGRQPHILAPRSPLLAPRAISLTEVLIAMGILTLGLLGVAALFPVGGYYMQRAEISDRGSQIGQAAMNQLVTSGMLDPRGWRMMSYQASGVTAIPGHVQNSYQRPLVDALSSALAVTAGQTTATRQQNLARLFGHAFVLDPMAVSATSLATPTPANRTVSVFPSSALAPPSGGGYSSMWAAWKPWWGSGSSEYTWPIRRVTFPQPSGSANINMTPVIAEHLFRGRDDLATDLPDRDDRPAAQNWDIVDVGGTSMPLARTWTGDYSWIATVVPTTNAARDAIASNPESHAYDVSIVVFHKRVLNRGTPQSVPDVTAASVPLMDNERYVKAGVLSTGLTGGELLLQQIGTATESPYMHLKAGQWIALCGPHPASSSAEPRFVLKWYQVMSIDSEGNGISGFNPTTNRVVTLRGPQWPWLPAASLSGGDLSNNLCVCIVRGAVAVHTKTLRLEGRRGSAWGGGADSFWTSGQSGPGQNIIGY